ncbi:tRNA dihydrouridine(20/20a) synthase DusA [Novispirillum itersonii]|uniref:tRNA dihydrouridine(20/20a) synthase DusA n=1 Tax=Novispirillum itersonii TaxID=189 RepID=UPI0009DB805B
MKQDQVIKPDKSTHSLPRRLSVAPMLDWTDRHYRMFARGLTRRTLLYTEMVVTGAILFGQRPRFLDYDARENPLALQLGGSDPAQLAECARIAEEWGYAEVNLNVGCPSDRVSSGRFGACLMAEPELVADGVKAMQDACGLPVTVKHRLGIDDLDSYDHLRRFIDTVSAAGCRVFIIHARKAWLKGLSPKENREIPPLRHDVVHRVKQDYPHLDIVLNGGLKSLEECLPHLTDLQGCMIGRAAYETPYSLAQADQLIYGDPHPPVSRHDAVRAFVPYVEAQLLKGVPLHSMTRHILGIFQGLPGARAWRRHLSENAPKKGADLGVLLAALAHVPEQGVPEQGVPEQGIPEDVPADQQLADSAP